MSFVIGLFTFLLVVDCLLLILLVLIQLPKKDAGVGQAFGGGATDALFGAGSGTALTKMTKYVTGIFFFLTLSLSVMNAHQNRGKAEDPRKYLTQGDKPPAISQPAAATTPPANTNVTKVPTNLLSVTQTNNPAAPATNAATNKAAKPTEEK